MDRLTWMHMEATRTVVVDISCTTYAINQHYRARLHTIITNKQYPPKSTQIIINYHANLSHTGAHTHAHTYGQLHVGDKTKKWRNDSEIVMYLYDVRATH